MCRELLRKGSEDAVRPRTQPRRSRQAPLPADGVRWRCRHQERMALLQQLVAKCKASSSCEAGHKAALAAAEAALGAVAEMVWGFPLTIEGPRPATKAGDSPYAADEAGVKTHAMLDAVGDSVVALNAALAE